jgi:hypothetical protein
MCSPISVYQIEPNHILCEVKFCEFPRASVLPFAVRHIVAFAHFLVEFREELGFTLSNFCPSNSDDDECE